MKNRDYRVLVTLALMASLVVGNIAGTSVNVQAADNKDKSTETKKTSETKTSSSATPTKDETVYVKVDDAGNRYGREIRKTSAIREQPQRRFL